MIPALLFSALAPATIATPAAGDQAAAWEAWASAAGTFRKDGSDPGQWQNVSHPGTERFELITPADFPNLRRLVNGHWVTVTDPLAAAQRLVEVRLNRISYEYIRSHGLYTVGGQRRAVMQGKVDFPIGSIQLKAGWRPINEPERARYHTMTLHLADGSSRLYGLTALNIAEKTRGGWLWASFEHTDAAGQHYRLRGTQTTYVDAAGQPLRLGNTELEAGLGDSASCMTCHARAALSVTPGEPERLPVFAPSPSGTRRGYVGTPDPDWFGHADAQGNWHITYSALDFVWSLAQAAEPGTGAAGPGTGDPR